MDFGLLSNDNFGGYEISEYLIGASKSLKYNQGKETPRLKANLHGPSSMEKLKGFKWITRSTRKGR